MDGGRGLGVDRERERQGKARNATALPAAKIEWVRLASILSLLKLFASPFGWSCSLPFFWSGWSEQRVEDSPVACAPLRLRSGLLRRTRRCRAVLHHVPIGIRVVGVNIGRMVRSGVCVGRKVWCVRGICVRRDIRSIVRVVKIRDR